MRLAVGLSGTDWGLSGIGTYVRALLPLFPELLKEPSDRLIAIGSRRDHHAYAAELGHYEHVVFPGVLDSPAASAAFYLLRAGAWARRAGADALLLPAANRRVAVMTGLPTVGVVHDLAQLHVAEKYDPLRMAYFKLLLRTLGTMDVLVAISSATRDDLAGVLGNAGPPVRVVANGVDCDRFTPPAPDDPRVRDARAALDLPGPFLLYPARLEHPGKNHLRLLRAFAKTKARDSATLLLTGRDWGAGPLIQSEIAALGLGDRVRVAGYVPDAQLAGAVAGAEVVVMLGLHEGFGLPALEALAAGRATCVSNTGALPEVVGDLGVKVDPLDEDSIAAGLDHAMFDPAFRARAAAEGPDWARARSWSKTAVGLLAACREARDTAKPRRPWSIGKGSW